MTALRRPTVTALLLLCIKSTQAWHASAAASIAKPNSRRASSPPHLLFNFSPPPPPPPATTPATQVVRRDLFGYVGLISLVAATPAIDWNGIGGNELSNIARLSYFTVVAIGSAEGLSVWDATGGACERLADAVHVACCCSDEARARLALPLMGSRRTAASNM